MFVSAFLLSGVLGLTLREADVNVHNSLNVLGMAETPSAHSMSAKKEQQLDSIPPAPSQLLSHPNEAASVPKGLRGSNKEIDLESSTTGEKDAVSCQWAMELFRWTEEDQSMAKISILKLVNDMSTHVNLKKDDLLLRDLEKNFLNSFDGATTWQLEGVTVQQFQTLTMCVIDKQNGRTILQKITEWGFDRLVNHKFGKSLINLDSLFVLDNDGNNLLHLAVKSESAKMVNLILSQVMAASCSVEARTALFLHTNKAGQTPISIANTQRFTSIQLRIRSLFNVLSAPKKFTKAAKPKSQVLTVAKGWPEMAQESAFSSPPSAKNIVLDDEEDLPIESASVQMSEKSSEKIDPLVLPEDSEETESKESERKETESKESESKELESKELEKPEEDEEEEVKPQEEEEEEEEEEDEELEGKPQELEGGQNMPQVKRFVDSTEAQMRSRSEGSSHPTPDLKLGMFQEEEEQEPKIEEELTTHS